MNNNIKKLDKIIVYIKIFKLKILKIKNIQLIKDFKIDKIILIITCQINYKDKNLNINSKKLEK